MEDIIKIKVDTGDAVAEIETVDSAMQKLDTTTQETTEATKSLKAQIREATQELLNMSDDDPRRQKLIEQIGEMKDQMADAADQIKGNTGPAFESMGNTFGIMTGQLANLDFDGLGKSLTQVGASIGKVNFKMLKDELGGLVKGIGDMGKALLANPIFAIGGAIAAVIVYWDELSSAVSNFNITQGEAIDNMMKSDAMLKETEGLQIQQAEIELLVRAVNDHSKSEEERRGALDKVNYALEQNGIAAINDINNTAGIINAKNLLIQKLQQEAKVRGQMAYLEELYAKQARLNAEKGFTTTVSEANAAGLALLGLEGGVIQSMTDMGSSMFGTTVTDLQNIQKEIDFISNSIYNDQQALDALQIKNFEKVEVKKNDIIKKGGEIRKKTQEEILKEEADALNKLNEDIKKIQERFAESQRDGMSAQEKEIFALQKKQEEETKLYEKAKKSEDDKQLLRLAHEMEYQALLDKYDKEAEEADKAKREAERQAQQERLHQKQQEIIELQSIIDEADEANYQASLTQQQIELLAINDKYFTQIEMAKQAGLDTVALQEAQNRELDAVNDKYRKEQEEKDRALMDAKLELTSRGLSALSELIGSFNVKDEKRAKKQFQIMKGIQMASALIDTYKAITGALADTSPIPYYMKVANAAIAGATGFAQVAKIAQTSFNNPAVTDGGGGLNGQNNGGGGGGMQAPPIDFSFMQQTGQPNTVETYVLAGNVANALEARQKIIDQSHL